MNELRFRGTDNPRQLRALDALMRGPVPRELMDRAAGASNGPAVVAALRRRGLSIPCSIVQRIDRDGDVCRPGVYALTAADRRLVQEWLKGQQG